MQIPGVHIETLYNPVRYTYSQIEKACAIAQLLNRGKLVLVEPPTPLIFVARRRGAQGICWVGGEPAQSDRRAAVSAARPLSTGA